MSCTRSNIEDVFGIGNVEKWADLDNDKSPVKGAARVARAIVVARAELEDALRDGIYAIPFAGTSTTLEDLCARMAGIWLYDNRGISEYDQEGKPIDVLTGHRARVERTIKRIRTGEIRLPLTRKVGVSVVPQVVDTD